MGIFKKHKDATSEQICRQIKHLLSFKEIGVHIIFDVKLDGKFTRKACLVSGGHKTDPPLTNTYSTVVLQGSVRITGKIRT